MAKILIIDKCEQCYHFNKYFDQCSEDKRKFLNEGSYSDISNPQVIDPGCLLQDADKEGDRG